MVFALVAGAAIAHATWNLTIKHARTSGVRFLWLTFAVGALLYAPFGIASLAQSHTALDRLALLAVGSGILQVSYFLLLQRGYRVGDVSVVYPLARGTGPLLSVVFALILFGETPTWLGIAGALVVIVGVVVIGLAGSRGSARPNSAGIVYGLLVGVMIAAYTLWDANSVLEQRMPPVGYYWASLLVQAALFAVPALRRPRAVVAIARGNWWEVLVVGILCPLAYILVLFAFQLAPVSIVAPAREASVVLVGLGGWLLFHEPHPARRLAGAAIVLAGVALLALA